MSENQSLFHLVISNEGSESSSASVLFGTLDLEDGTIDITSSVVQWRWNPKCVLFDRSQGQLLKSAFVADFGTSDSGHTGGVMIIDRTGSDSVRYLPCLSGPEFEHAWGLSQNVDGELMASFPRRQSKNVVIVSDPLLASASVVAEIGAHIEQFEPIVDGPAEFASTYGTTCLDSAGRGAIIILKDRIKIIFETCNPSRGMLKWTRILRQFHESCGIVDECM